MTSEELDNLIDLVREVIKESLQDGDVYTDCTGKTYVDYLITRYKSIWCDK